MGAAAFLQSPLRNSLDRIAQARSGKRPLRRL
jgi:hypothetical protein